MHLICFLVTFAACIIGTVCGMGGGIVIKPVLDAAGVMSVASVTFLSGCTVIAMSCWNVGKTTIKKESVLDLHSTPCLAVGAALGGLAGKQLLIWLPRSLRIGIRQAVCRPACCSWRLSLLFCIPSKRTSFGRSTSGRGWQRL